MPRTSPVHYIAPSAISITPNANGSANDLAVYVARGAKIKVYSPRLGLGMVNGAYQEWTISGVNRRLAESLKPYTVYARLPKTNRNNGYLVFAPKVQYGNEWVDKYPYITTEGLADVEGIHIGDNNWWVRLGDVSLPENGARTLTLDTGILGTDEFNTNWALNPDALPLRMDIGCTINDEDAGPTPYVYWGKSLVLTVSLTEGWTGTEIERFDHWEIIRNSGDATTDTEWNNIDRSAGFGASGQITLSHARGSGDDFNGAVATTFIIKAIGIAGSSDNSDSSDGSSSSSGEEFVELISSSIVILAETVEKYELSYSESVVSYDPRTKTYTPPTGISLSIRATDQRGNVFYLTRGQINNASLTASYAPSGSSSWTQLSFEGAAAAIATAVIPVSAFYNQQNVNVRLTNADNTELANGTIAFVRDGEDSKEREWIFLRSTEAITFGTQAYPYPADINGGEVNPTGAATGLDTDKNQDGWVPEGWYDEMQGVSEEYPFEYSACRDYIHENESEDSDSDSSSSGENGGHWGDFYEPKLWSHYGKDGEPGKDAPITNVNMLLRTVFESGLDFIKEKWEATNWNWVSMDSSQDAQYIEGHQSLRFVIPAGSNEMMFYQSVLGILKPNTWYTFSFNLFASKSVTFCIHNIEGSTYKNVYTDGKVIVDGVERTGVTNDHNDVDILVPSGGTLWDGKRHYITFKTNSNVVTGASDTLRIGWYFSNQSADAAQNFVLCMPKLEEGQVATTYVANDEDFVGEDGEDGYAFRTNPTSVIITEGRNRSTNAKTYDVSASNPKIVTVKANVAGIDKDVSLTSVTVPANTLTIASGYSGTTSFQITGIDSGFTGTSVQLTVSGTCDGKEFTLPVNVYVNRLGTAVINVFDDTITEVATKMEYGYEHPDAQQVDTIQHMGQYIRSSEENISTIQSDVYDQQTGDVKLATKSEVEQTAAGITSTVESIAGSGKNLLTGSEDYISTNKLKHKSKEKDGYIEYPPNNNGVKIYSAYDLVAGKEYVLQCKSDGTLADRHWGDAGVDPRSCCYTVWMRYFGDDSHDFCFTSANLGGTEADGSLWWKFTPEISGTYYFRTNSYSDGSTEVTINFWDIMCSMGSTAPSWVAPKRDTTKSVVTQTASEYDVSIRNALGDTGININGNNRTIRLMADHTIIDGDLSVPKVITQGNGTGGTGYKIEVDENSLKAYNGRGSVGLCIGWENGNPFLFITNGEDEDSASYKGIKLTYDGIINTSGNFSSDSFDTWHFMQLIAGTTPASSEIYNGTVTAYSEKYLYTAAKNLVTGVYQDTSPTNPSVTGYSEKRAARDGKTYTLTPTWSTNEKALHVLDDNPTPYLAGYYITPMNNPYTIDNIVQKDIYGFINGLGNVAGKIYVKRIYNSGTGDYNYYFCNKNGSSMVPTFDLNHIYDS